MPELSITNDSIVNGGETLSHEPGKTLKLVIVDDSWAVDHTGSDREFGVGHLFGTAVLPTPYPSNVPADEVVREIGPGFKADGYTLEVVR